MIEVIATGPLAIIQDLGRPGYQHLGVSRSGAADRRAHRLANRLVGNAETAATIEFSLGGLVVRLHNPATIALTGAHCPGGPGWQVALTVSAGYRLALGPPPTGLRSYLAVRGGIAVERVLGSRSTDLLSGLGPPVLTPAVMLPVGEEVTGEPSGAVPPEPPIAGSDGTIEVGVLAGPRLDWFSDPYRLLDQAWTVLPESNRVGIRLAGNPLHRCRVDELPTEPTLPGAIQVPPDGQPIVLFRDAPVTGGYPVIGVLPTPELDRMAQLRPGSRLHFVRVAG